MVKMTFDEFDRLSELMEKLGKPEYYPTMNDIANIVGGNPDKYLLFLAWILTRPAETEEEKRVERVIRKIVQENLSLTDTDEE